MSIIILDPFYPLLVIRLVETNQWFYTEILLEIPSKQVQSRKKLTKTNIQIALYFLTNVIFFSCKQCQIPIILYYVENRVGRVGGTMTFDSKDVGSNPGI